MRYGSLTPGNRELSGSVIHWVKTIGAALLAAALLLACGGGGSSTPAAPAEDSSSEDHEAAAAPSPTPNPHVCPVDQEICDFALNFEASLQRGDAWTAEGRYVLEEPPTGLPPADAILALLKQRQFGVAGTPRPQVALQSIACVEGTMCEESFVLTYSAFADLPGEPDARVGSAIVGFKRTADGPVLIGLNGHPDPPGTLFGGGTVEHCGIAGTVQGTCPKPLVAYPFQREGSPPPDTALGHEATPLTVGPDAEFPPDTSILVALSGYGHGHGGYFDLVRYTREGNGPVTRTVVWPGQGESVPEGSNVTGVEAAPDGTLWLSRCIGAECYLEGGSHEKDVYTEFHRSLDGGVSWEKVAERDGEWYVRGTVGSDAFAIGWGSDAVSWIRLPSLEQVEPPAGTAESAPPIDWYGWVNWPAADAPELMGPTGRPAVVLPLDTASGPVRIDGVRHRPRPDTSAALVTEFPPEAEFRHVINRYAVLVESRFEEGLGVQALLRLDGALFQLGPFLGDSRMLVTAEYSRETGCVDGVTESGAIPAILDFTSASLRLIGDPFSCEAGAVRVVSAMQGPFLTVETPEDCLNLRVAPGVTATVITCLGHGALVRPTTDKAEAGGQQWLRVELEGRLSGWVASEFLLP